MYTASPSSSPSVQAHSPLVVSTPSLYQAAWPARGDHAVAVGAGQFWLVAGRGINSLVYGETELYNDVWTSVDGVSWRLNSTGGPFIPRCMHLLVCNPQPWPLAMPFF